MCHCSECLLPRAVYKIINVGWYTTWLTLFCCLRQYESRLCMGRTMRVNCFFTFCVRRITSALCDVLDGKGGSVAVLMGSRKRGCPEVFTGMRKNCSTAVLTGIGKPGCTEVLTGIRKCNCTSDLTSIRKCNSTEVLTGYSVAVLQCWRELGSVAVLKF